MSLCYFHLGEWQKSISNATRSLDSKKTIKAFFRRAKASEKLNQFEKAIQDMTAAVKLDPSDTQDIQQEVMQLKQKQKAYEKKQQEKMSGFLLK